MSQSSERTARALVLEQPRTLVERSLPVPDVGDDDGLLRVEACGLCGTDHELYTGTLPSGFAFVPGHESVGIVEAVGPKAAERWGVTVPGTGPGDVVAVLGPGVRGLSACAAAKEAGAAFVMVTGVSPHDDERLALAHAFGADLAVDVGADDPSKAIRAATGGGAD